MTELIKSPLIQKKEKELADLEQQIKKARTNLKRYRTRMKNVKRDVENNMREGSSMVMEMMQKVTEYTQKILDTNAKIQNSKTISDEEKEAVQGFIYEILGVKTEEEVENVEDIFEQFKAENSFDEAEFEQKQKEKTIDPFEQFKANIPKEEQQNIRKAYIRLANKFHPDKANNPQEVKFFHDTMQQINEAYKAGDYLSLLELENQYADYESKIPEEDANELTNFLEKTIERKQNELDLIQKQYQRLKDEMKSLRNSEYGMVMNAHKENYWGASPLEMERQNMAQQVEAFSELLEVLEDFEQTGEMSEALFDEIFPPEEEEMPVMHEMNEELLDEIIRAFQSMENEMSQATQRKSRKRRKRRKK